MAKELSTIEKIREINPDTIKKVYPEIHSRLDIMVKIIAEKLKVLAPETKLYVHFGGSRHNYSILSAKELLDLINEGRVLYISHIIAMPNVFLSYN